MPFRTSGMHRIMKVSSVIKRLKLQRFSLVLSLHTVLLGLRYGRNTSPQPLPLRRRLPTAQAVLGGPVRMCRCVSRNWSAATLCGQLASFAALFNISMCQNVAHAALLMLSSLCPFPWGAVWCWRPGMGRSRTGLLALLAQPMRCVSVRAAGGGHRRRGCYCVLCANGGRAQGGVGGRAAGRDGSGRHAAAPGAPRFTVQG